MAKSRLERVRGRRAEKQGMTYLIAAIVLIIITVIWGLPAVAKITEWLTKPDDGTIQVSDQRPAPPIFSDIPEATYSAQVKIAGYAQPGLDVILYINGAEYERKLVTESGTFTFEKVSLKEGENSAYGYTATPRDLQSEQSKTYVIVVDSTKPEITITAPSDGKIFKGQADRITNIEGSVNELGSKVYIGERMVIVQSDGKFSLPYQLIEGDQEIIIKAVDKAGNEGKTSIKLRWEP